MAEKVGEIYYDVTLDTRQMIDGQRKVDRELKNTSGSLDSFGAKLTATAAAAAILAAGLAAMQIAKTADEFRLLTARVEVAAGSIESGTAAFAELVAISRNTQTSLAGNIEVFTRLNQSLIQMGGTQRDTLQLTELLAKAIKVSGASAVEAKSAMLQFGQALGSGKLAGDELRSLLENAPYLMRQLADGIGVPIGSLKKLGEEGKLTADVVVNALTKATAKIDEDFKKFPQTIESAMQVARDSAALAALKFDELSGSSAGLTGAAKGVGEVLDKLADQFGAANSEAGILGRNDAVRSWADTTRNALSYLIDGADMLWQTLSVLGRNVSFVFKGIGSEIGGIAAQASAVVRGDFAGAKAIGEQMVADAASRRKQLDAEDAKTLGRAKLAGQAMREAWQQGAGGGRGVVNPTTAPSKLKASAEDPKKPKAAKKTAFQKFDDAGYLAGLEARSLDAWDRVNVIEIEAKRKNDVLLAEKKISAATHEKALTLIAADAIQERQKLMEADLQKEIADGQRRMEMRERGRSVAQEAIASVNPIDKIRLEEEQKIAVIEEFRLLDLENTQLYEDAKLAIKATAAERIKAVDDDLIAKQQSAQSAQFTAYENLFAGIAGVTKSFAGEQSGIYKAMFAVSKAFAIADSIVKIQQGIAAAASLPFPANIPAIGSVIAATSGVISTISGANFGGGRQYGGPASAGSMYRVNETGAPEMFTGSNGQQYMLPTKSGQVTPADQVGGGAVQWQIIINNTAAGTTASASVDQNAKTVEIAVSEVANQIANNSGKVWSALRGSSNVRGAL